MRVCLGLKVLDNCFNVLGGPESLDGLKVLDHPKVVDRS